MRNQVFESKIVMSSKEYGRYPSGGPFSNEVMLERGG